MLLPLFTFTFHYGNYDTIQALVQDFLAKKSTENVLCVRLRACFRVCVCIVVVSLCNRSLMRSLSTMMLGCLTRAGCHSCVT